MSSKRDEDNHGSSEENEDDDSGTSSSSSDDSDDSDSDEGHGTASYAPREPSQVDEFVTARVIDPATVQPLDESELGRPIKDLSLHIARLKKSIGKKGDGFDLEFNYVEKKSQSDSYFGDYYSAVKPHNRGKNRYSNVLPLEQTRVKLESKRRLGGGSGLGGSGSALGGSEDSGYDYINANWIDGLVPGSEKSYISTQGPLQETVEDFWRMVWEKDSNVIVMLTKEIENEKTKCDRYWPEEPGNTFTFDSLFVTMLEEEKAFEDRLVIRKFRIGEVRPTEGFQYWENSKLREEALRNSSKSGGRGGGSEEEEGGNTTTSSSSSSTQQQQQQHKPPREVMHFQYQDWPDYGLPKNAVAFRAILHKVDETRTNRSPIVVHCSAGIGRTGTFCTVHSTLEKINLQHSQSPTEPPEFNILQTVLRMRKQRVGMVQTKEQYIFCYKALYEETQKLGL